MVAIPVIAAPNSGASQNTDSCRRAPSPLKNVTLVDNARVDRGVEIGIEIRWISVKVRLIEKPVNPLVRRHRWSRG